MSSFNIVIATCRRLLHSSDPPRLSHELWAKVFANLDAFAASDESYIQFHKLRLVSKQFGDIFQQNSYLSRGVRFHKSVTPEVLTSFLEWLSLKSTAVEKLAMVNSDSEYQDIILGALLSRPQRCCLDFFQGTFMTDTALILLASFDSLTSCNLELDHDNCLDLAPLHALSHLKQLQLTTWGRFVSNLHTLSYLTSLILDDVQTDLAALSPVCGFVSVLQTLQLSDSRVRINPGMTAFQKLKTLTFRSDIIVAGSAHIHEDTGNAWQMVEDLLPQVPTNMSALTSLTSLSVHTFLTAATPDLDWIYHLQTLKELSLHFAEDMEICASLTCLSQLNRLVLTAEHDSVCPESVWKLSFEWSRMSMLRELALIHCKFQVMENFKELALLPNLSKIRLKCCTPADPQSFSNLFALACTVQSCRQDVHLKLEDYF